MADSPGDPASDVRPRAAISWVQAAVVVALAGLWLCPLVVVGLTLWWDGTPWARIGCALGIGGGLGFLLLPEGSYRPRAWERSGRVYLWLGVRWFKRWTPDGDWVAAQLRRALPDYRLIASRTDLSDFERRTRRAEQVHSVMLAVAVPPLLYAAFSGWAMLAAWLLVGNLLINMYPILVQRYNRARSPLLGSSSSGQTATCRRLRSGGRTRRCS